MVELHRQHVGADLGALAEGGVPAPWPKLPAAPPPPRRMAFSATTAALMVIRARPSRPLNKSPAEPIVPSAATKVRRKKASRLGSIRVKTRPPISTSSSSMMPMMNGVIRGGLP
jgi:hypothetical protein